MKKTLTLKKLIYACFFLLLTLGLNSSFGQGVDSPNNCVPPSPQAGTLGGPEYIGQFHATYSDGTNVYDLTQPQHDGFANCDPPPPATGGTTTHSMGSQVRANVSVNGGPVMAVTAPAQMTVMMMKMGGADPQTGNFQTEMLQLDIQGGNLPPGMRIRESPTLQSTGQTTIVHNGTGYHIDSFFDIFTELSVDGGATWHPTTTGAGHVVLTTPSAAVIPTMNQWGLIIFSILILSLIFVYVNKLRTV